MTPTQVPTRPPQDLATLADQCVMCGLCVPRCPTYGVDALEGRSPRGRIAHMRRLATQDVAPTEALLADLDSCLSCGRCESVCPSQVRYAQMLPQARALLRGRRGEPLLRRLLRALAGRPAWMRALLRLARALPRPRGGDHGGFGTLRTAAHAVASAGLDPRVEPARTEAPRGRVLLLRGCVGAAIESDTHRAAATLLAASGYAVEVQRHAACCGSLARQAGALEAARRDGARLREQVRAANADAVVSCASGCLPALREALDHPDMPPVHELLDFLVAARAPDAPTMPAAGSRRRVALAVPCSQQALDGGAAARRQLGAVAGIELVELPDAPGCCGAGAMQFIADPQTARRLRGQRAAQIAASGACMVATTNTGCRLHLAMGLAEAGLHIPVLHPAVIMAQSMRPDDDPCAATAPPTA